MKSEENIIHNTYASIKRTALEEIVRKSLLSIDFEKALEEERQKTNIPPLSKSMQLKMDLIDFCCYLRETYDNDPLITFYFMHDKMKNIEMVSEEEFITIFNEQFETRYKDSNDFLLQNGFASFIDMKRYLEEYLELLKATTRR